MISRVPDAIPVVSAETNDLPSDLSGKTVKDLTQLFKLLADETRLRILELLGDSQELCVRELWERLGQSQPAVSHHLGLLRMGGLVDTRHQGKHIFYRIDQRRFDELIALIHQTRFGAQVFSTPG
jgi:ArsR family transcriptional regulator